MSYNIMFKIERMLLPVVIAAALILRIYGINWDQGYHLHPDERMLIMVTEKLDFFKNLNPNFFNYGSLPMYLLRLFSPEGNYDSLLLSGRKLSIVFDLLTIIFIYKITKILSSSPLSSRRKSGSNKIALLSSFLYAISFFPIQNSHFFVVDVFLTTFTTILVYLLLKLSLQAKRNNLVLIGIVFAAMLSTKFTAIIFYPIIIGVIMLKTVKKFRNLILSLLIFHLSFAICHFLFMPYAYIDFPKFTSDIKLQLQMNSNPYIFPYTLQYVETTPYFYYLKNIFLWGLGPFISTLSLFGLMSLRSVNWRRSNLFLFFVFYFFYFLIVGRSSVKFMRYMLPMYPFFTILAAYGFYTLLSPRRRSGSRLKIIHWIPAFAGMTIMIIWTMMFVSIYFRPHTRITATEWMLKNIPVGSTIAVEHWDDRLPIFGSNNYNFEELTLYDQPDDNAKWKILNDKLENSDYLVIASNRLYVPLQNLVDCQKYQKCYPKTAEYYKKLFDNKLTFEKTAEFSVYPKLEVGDWKLEIHDDSADESFTVYDHPKIMIFKKSH